MNFWSKQSSTKEAPAPPPTQFSSEFDQHFGIRYSEAKEIAAAIEDVNPYQLDWDGLDALEASANRIIQLDREFLLDLQREVQRNPRLMADHLSVPSLFKKFVREAARSLQQVRAHRRRLKRQGVPKPAELTIEPYPIRDPHGVVVYDVFGSLLFHSWQPTIPAAIAQSQIDVQRRVEEYQRTGVVPVDMGESVSFKYASLPGVDLPGIVLEGEDFYGANLAYANFSGATLSECTFNYCNLTGVDFRGSDLSNCNFRNTTIDGTNFYGANLMSADFWEATIQLANMAQADLSWVNFPDASITSVDFSGSNLAEADFSGADIASCIFYDVEYGNKAVLAGATIDFSTVGLQEHDRAKFISAIGLHL